MGQGPGATATTTATSFGPVSISNGPVSWYVIAEFQGGCGPLQSQTATFNGCNTADAPLPSDFAAGIRDLGASITDRSVNQPSADGVHPPDR